ncbi:hypothetical protein HDU93_008291 [Gonapodya sp. JEL0774]|nr:hypothetical protein HDU93_008291 [Gonapodya sp. JEL0774]
MAATLASSATRRSSLSLVANPSAQPLSAPDALPYKTPQLPSNSNESASTNIAAASAPGPSISAKSIKSVASSALSGSAPPHSAPARPQLQRIRTPQGRTSGAATVPSSSAGLANERSKKLEKVANAKSPSSPARPPTNTAHTHTPPPSKHPSKHAPALPLPLAPTFTPSLHAGNANPSRSPSLSLLIHLNQVFSAHPDSPSKERARASFAVLDSIIPLLPIYADLLLAVRHELHASVYSQTLTASPQSPADSSLFSSSPSSKFTKFSSPSPTTAIERLPHFSTAQRVLEIRAEEVALSEERIKELETRLKQKEGELVSLNRRNMQLNELGLLAAASFLSCCVTTTRLFLHSSLHLDDQLSSILNLQIEDYELHLSNLARKRDIARRLAREVQRRRAEREVAGSIGGGVDYEGVGGVGDATGTEIQGGAEEEEEEARVAAEREDAIRAEVASLSLTFRTKVSSLLSEQVATRSHRQQLRSLLEIYDTKRNGSGPSSGSSGASGTGGGGVSTDTVRRVADESTRVYAVIAEYSVDGGVVWRSWGREVGVKFCGKCGERTVVCPHQPAPPIPLPVPSGATHIRFRHPKLRLRVRLTPEGKIEADKARAAAREAASGPGVGVGEAVRVVVDDAQNGNDWDKVGARERESAADVLYGMGVTDDDDDADEETEDLNFEQPKTYRYEHRKGVKPRTSRSWNLDKLELFITEVYDERWDAEEKAQRLGQLIKLGRLVDTFFEFLHRRYQIDEITLRVAHDIIAALQRFDAMSVPVSLFARHLSGEEDALWKYIRLVDECFARYEPLDLERWRQAARVVWPGRDGSTYEQIELEAVAFSKNIVSKERSVGHVVHMIREGLEPNYKFFYLSLLKSDAHSLGSLTLEDFHDTLSTLCPAIPSLTKRDLYGMAELDFLPDRGGQVCHERLAVTASFLLLDTERRTGWQPLEMFNLDWQDLLNGQDETMDVAEATDVDGDGARLQNRRSSMKPPPVPVRQSGGSVLAPITE